MVTASRLTELEDQIRTRYDELSKRLQQVAVYVLENKNRVAFDTVSVIAEHAGVPPSTLIRFADAFGFSGFNAMKRLFRNNLLEETYSYTDRIRLLKELSEDNAPLERPVDILREFARANGNALHQLAARTPIDKLDAAVEMLADARNIYVVGLGRSFSVSSYLAYALRHLHKRVFLIDGLGGMFKEQLLPIESEDVLVVISFSPYAKETMVISDSLMGSGTRQIIVTDSQISPLASFSDICFVVKEAKVDAFRSQAASLCLVQTLAVSLAFRDDKPR